MKHGAASSVSTGLGRRQGSGFTDKLFWRVVGSGSFATWHCFIRRTREDGGGWLSLCGDWRIWKTGGQAIDRPEPWQRCGRCDAHEMERRGHDESLPARRAKPQAVAG